MFKTLLLQDLIALLLLFFLTAMLMQLYNAMDAFDMFIPVNVNLGIHGVLSFILIHWITLLTQHFSNSHISETIQGIDLSLQKHMQRNYVKNINP